MIHSFKGDLENDIHTAVYSMRVHDQCVVLLFLQIYGAV